MRARYDITTGFVVCLFSMVSRSRGSVTVAVVDSADSANLGERGPQAVVPLRELTVEVRARVTLAAGVPGGHRELQVAYRSVSRVTWYVEAQSMLPAAEDGRPDQIRRRRAFQNRVIQLQNRSALSGG